MGSRQLEARIGLSDTFCRCRPWLREIASLHLCKQLVMPRRLVVHLGNQRRFTPALWESEFIPQAYCICLYRCFPLSGGTPCQCRGSLQSIRFLVSQTLRVNTSQCSRPPVFPIGIEISKIGPRFLSRHDSSHVESSGAATNRSRYVQDPSNGGR